MKMLKENHEFLNGDRTTELMISDCLYKYTFYKIDIKYKTEDDEVKKCPYESNTVADDDILSLFDKSDGSDIESTAEYQLCLLVKNSDENVDSMRARRMQNIEVTSYLGLHPILTSYTEYY